MKQKEKLLEALEKVTFLGREGFMSLPKTVVASIETSYKRLNDFIIKNTKHDRSRTALFKKNK